MASQQGPQPSAKAGILLDNNWSDYGTPQSYFNAFAPKMEISTEAGKTGAPGEPGPASEAAGSEYEMNKVTSVPIPAGATSVNLGLDPFGLHLQLRSETTQATLATEAFSLGMVEGQIVHLVFNAVLLADKEVARDGWFVDIYRLTKTQ